MEIIFITYGWVIYFDVEGSSDAYMEKLLWMYNSFYKH